MLNVTLNFSILALIITNLWIVIYNGLLTYLNFLNPPVVKEQFLRDIALPKPFDIQLYLVLTIVFAGLIWLILKSFSTLKITYFGVPYRKLIFLKVILLGALLLLFLGKLDSYPLGNLYEPFTLRTDKSIYWIVLTIYLLLIALVTFESAVLENFLSKSKKILYFFVLLIIGLVTFEPRFPISAHDYAFFFAPILEIANGKTIITDLPVQHGFLSILLMTGLYKIGLFNLNFLPVFIWLLYLAEYFLIFYIVYKLSKSITLSLLGLFSLLTLNYFSLYHLPIALPQTGPMRWLPAIFLLLILLRRKIDAKVFILLLALLSFWVIDAGVSLILAYLLTLFFLFINKEIQFVKALRSGILLALFVLSIAVTINLLHLALGYKSIEFLNIFTRLKEYAAQGIAQMPMPDKTYFWLVLFTYFASIIYFFKFRENPKSEILNPKQIQNTKLQKVLNGFDNLNFLNLDLFRASNLEFRVLLLFSANLMLFASIYYIGRPHPHNLFHVSTLWLFNLFILLALIFRKIEKNKLLVLTSYILVFILLIVYPAFMRRYTMAEIFSERLQRLKTGNIFQPDLEQRLNKQYSQEAKLINSQITDEQVLILTTDDSYLFYLTGKKNLLSENPQVAILSETALQKAIQTAVRVCPSKIAADCSAINKCQPYKYFGEPAFQTGRILAEIEKGCKIKYQPIECTDQICIMEKL